MMVKWSIPRLEAGRGLIPHLLPLLSSFFPLLLLPPLPSSPPLTTGSHAAQFGIRLAM